MVPTTAPSFSFPTLEPTDTPIAPPSFEPTQVPIVLEATLQPTVYDTQMAKIEQIEKIKESVIPEDRRGYDLVMKHFGNDTDVWKDKCRVCPFTFVKGKTSEARVDGCVLLATGKVDTMDPGKTTTAVYVCTDKIHSLMLDTEDLLQVGLKEIGAEGRNWESGSTGQHLPGITTIIAGKDLALQGYYDRGFVDPIPSAENDDGTEEIKEKNIEIEEEKENKLEKLENSLHVVNQLSEVPCIFNVNFGMVEEKDSVMYVDVGCQAQFKSNDGALLSCMSLDYKYTECEIPIVAGGEESLKMETVELCQLVLEEELSPSVCSCGSNFGMVGGNVNSDAMWASHGCRGTFLSPDSTRVWVCTGDNIEYTVCKNTDADRHPVRNRLRRNLQEMMALRNSSSGLSEKFNEEIIEKEADSLNKDYENRWEFDPDEIVNENDQIMSLTIASRLVVRTSPFPDVCGGSDLSVATLEREVAEVGVKGKKKKHRP